MCHYGDPMVNEPVHAALEIPKSQYVDVEGAPVHWVDFGGPVDGPLAVCVHGLGGSWVNWLAFAPLLTDRYRVVAFDLVGNGRTPVAGRKADIRSNRRLLDGFLHTQTDQPVLLIGNSMGGLLSILQAAREPKSVDRLVLIDPALPPPRNQLPRDPRFLGGFLLMALPLVGERLLARRGKQLTPAQLSRQMLELVCADPSRVSPDIVRVSEELGAERAGRPELDRLFLGAARSLMGVLARPGRYLQAIRQITQPTLLIFGAKDRLVPVAAGRSAARSRPDWTYREHADLGHVPQIEDPGWTAQQVREWLGV
jgi:pimeloyl-ACP methyl ester carboxylesterase